MHSSRQMRPRQRLFAAALAAVVLWTGAACGQADEGSVSSDEFERDAKVIFRADLGPGSTGETAAKIVRRFARVDGVWGTRGDDGKHVWIYGMADATLEQIGEIEQRLNAVSAVASVRRLR
jgi:hypothetical protein